MSKDYVLLSFLKRYGKKLRRAGNRQAKIANSNNPTFDINLFMKKRAFMQPTS
jgi:hypothetical protein